MSPRICIHQGVWEILKKQYRGLKKHEDIGIINESSSLSLEVDEITPCWLGIFIGFVESSGRDGETEHWSAYALAVLKLRRISKMIASSTILSSECPMRRLEKISSILNRHEADLLQDIRSVVISVPLGAQAIGFVIGDSIWHVDPSEKSQRECTKDMIINKKFYSTLQGIGKIINRVFLEDLKNTFPLPSCLPQHMSYIESSFCIRIAAMSHFGDGFETITQRWDGELLVFRLDCTDDSAGSVTNFEITDLSQIVFGGKRYLLRARAPLELQLSSKTLLECLNLEGFTSCSCAPTVAHGVLMSSLIPSAAEQLVQQFQIYESLLIQGGGIAFKIPGRKWVYPGVEMEHDDSSLDTISAVCTYVEETAIKNTDKSSKENVNGLLDTPDLLGLDLICPEAVAGATKVDYDREICLNAQNSSSMPVNYPVWIKTAQCSRSYVAQNVVGSLVNTCGDEDGAFNMTLSSEAVLQTCSAAKDDFNKSSADLVNCVSREREPRDVKKAILDLICQDAGTRVCIMLDCLVMLHSKKTVNEATSALVAALLRQLRFVSSCIVSMARTPHTLSIGTLPNDLDGSFGTQPFGLHVCRDTDSESLRVSLSFHHYQPLKFGLPITGYAICTPVIRIAWLDLCCQNKLNPCFRPSRTLKPNPLFAFNRLISPHKSLERGPGWLKQADIQCVTAPYEYCHYMQDGVNDAGWGCCYRSLQTVISWYRLQGYTMKAIPTLWEIQALLKKFDVAHSRLKVGTKQWIGTIEGQYVLNWYLGFSTKTIYLNNITEILTAGDTLLQHFQEVGTPILMGVGNYAYCMVGIAVTDPPEETSYLIVDPHYTGDEKLQVILQKEWVSWKKMQFLEKAAENKFVNLTLPQLIREDEHLIF